MVIRNRLVNSRNLTGQRMFRCGWFGISLMYVEIKEGDNLIWRRCRDHEEWNWCCQFEQRSDYKTWEN